MGTAGLNAITYSGLAAVANFGQSRTISFGLASTAIRNYTRTIDFTQPASRAIGEASPPAGRGAPPPQPRPYEETIGADSPWAQQLSIWVTPWGFLRGAAANNATLKNKKVGDVSYRTLTWSPQQKAPSGQPYQIVGYIGPQNLVDRVETWVEHPIFGDMRVELLFQNYRDFGGVKSPTRIAERRMGMEMFVTAIQAVTANPVDLAQLMTSAPGAAPAAGRAGGPPATPAATCRWPWSSRTTSSCSKAGRAKHVDWPSSPKRNACFPPSGSSTWSTRIRTSITPAGCRRSLPKASRFSSTTTAATSWRRR